MDHQQQQETFEARAVRLSQVGRAFARMADGMLLHWRTVLGVPDHAEPDVEAELAALRRSFDAQFLPDFCRLYADVFRQHLDGEDAAVLQALEAAPVQAYMAAIERIETDLNVLLRQQLPALKAALTLPVR